MAALLLTTLVFGLSCAYRVPESHEAVVGKYASTEKQRLWEAVLHVLDQKEIPVAQKNFGSGTITSDSIPVNPEQVDCGKNFFGVDYEGSRLGVLKIRIRRNSEINIGFELGALLTITANKKQVRCKSFGTLEKEILQSIDLQLGLRRDQISKASK